jgi:hypothetical protein
MIDRREASRALAKSIAYKQCGKDREAELWARRLVEILECASILRPERQTRAVPGAANRFDFVGKSGPAVA